MPDPPWARTPGTPNDPTLTHRFKPSLQPTKRPTKNHQQSITNTHKSPALWSKPQNPTVASHTKTKRRDSYNRTKPNESSFTTMTNLLEQPSQTSINVENQLDLTTRITSNTNFTQSRASRRTTTRQPKFHESQSTTSRHHNNTSQNTNQIN